MVVSGAGVAPMAHVARQYASFGRRFAAWLVDVVLISAAAVALDRGGAELVPDTWNAGPEVFTVGVVVVTVLEVGYLVWFTSRGATLGKIMLRIRVIGPDGGSPGLARAARRYLLQAAISLALLAGDLTSSGNEAREGEWNPAGTLILLAVVAVVLVDHLSMLWHPENRTVHDRIGDTRVVDGPSGGVTHLPTS